MFSICFYGVCGSQAMVGVVVRVLCLQLSKSRSNIHLIATSISLWKCNRQSHGGMPLRNTEACFLMAFVKNTRQWAFNCTSQVSCKLPHQICPKGAVDTICHYNFIIRALIWNSLGTCITDEHHKWALRMSITYEHHIWASRMNITNKHYEWASQMSITNEHQIWASRMSITNELGVPLLPSREASYAVIPRLTEKCCFDCTVKGKSSLHLASWPE